MKNIEVLVLGSSNIDMIIKVDHLPSPGETVLGGAFTQAAGGKGANQAVAAARAGAQVTFVAAVGEDDLGLQAIAGYQQDQIDTQYIQRIAGQHTGVAMISVDAKGENCIAVASGANACLSADDVNRLSTVIQQSRVLLMQLETPLEAVRAAAYLASAHSSTFTILNPAPAQPLPDDLYPLLDLITPNETEAALMTGITVKDLETARQAGQQLLSKGVKQVILTLGAEGALWLTHDQDRHISGCQVHPVDTTAAGDTFNGALATCLAQGMKMMEAIAFANAAAALSVTQLGAQPSIPRKDAVIAFMKGSN